MDFFAQQRRVRGTSTRLVVLFVLAVIAIVAVVDFAVIIAPFVFGSGTKDGGQLVQGIVIASVLTLAIIGLGTLSKVVALRSGGAAVAMSVGAAPVDPTTTDPRLRRFVNICEEMSIASGVPQPRLFVLEREQGINAFAAGFRPADAAICVTAGALDRLDRDELQGVIGHEFSHVLNGDMRLNIKLIGLLFGILLLAIFGLRILPFSGQSFGRSRDKSLPLFAVALVLIVVGFVGQFFARLIQAAVSRQRELLADASAVQFTRQTDGLVGALRKIGAGDAAGGSAGAGSALSDKAAEGQLGHMLFGEGRARFARLFATHPPLEERIAVLSGVPVEGVRSQLGTAPAPTGASDFAGAAAAVADRVGSLTREDIVRAARINDGIPPRLRSLAGQRSTAVPLVLALLLDTRPDVRQAQLAAVAQQLGPQVAGDTDGILRDLGGLDRGRALPLAHLAVPQLVSRPDAERFAVARAIDALSRADGRITPFEYCLSRLLGVHLTGSPRPARASAAAVDGAVADLLAVVAASGNADPAAAQRAFAAACQRVLPGPVAFRPPPQPWDALDAAWPLLAALPPERLRALVEGVVAAVSDDGVLTVTEAELLRVTCGVLGCPLPPLLDAA